MSTSAGSPLSEIPKRILRIIEALKAKTQANGCTEDEAIAAAEKLRELLDAYNISLDEATVRKDGVRFHTERHWSDLVTERLWKLGMAVAKLMDTRYWTSKPGENPIRCTFAGLPHEIEVSLFLFEICRNAVASYHDTLRKRYALIVTARARRLVIPALDGMVDRLCERLIAMKPKRPTGTGIVPVRNMLIEAEMRARGIRTERHRNPVGSRIDNETYEDGRAAADRVNLNRGVTDTGKPTLRLR